MPFDASSFGFKVSTCTSRSSMLLNLRLAFCVELSPFSPRIGSVSAFATFSIKSEFLRVTVSEYLFCSFILKSCSNLQKAPVDAPLNE